MAVFRTSNGKVLFSLISATVNRIRRFLALEWNVGVLLLVVIFAMTGERLWLVFASKYLQTLGASIVVIGLFDALQTLLGALYAYPGGWLTDRWGQRKSLLLFSLISLSGYCLVLTWHHWLALVVGAFLFLAWSACSLPAAFSIVATSLHSSRHTMGVGVQSLVRRIPMMAGPLIGGWLVTRYGWHDGISFALLICIALTVITMVLQYFLVDPKVQTSPGDLPAGSLSLRQVVKSFTPALKELLISDILIRFCERIPAAFVILWAINDGGVTAQQYGWLIAFEMTTAMLCYIPVAHLADKYGRRPFVLTTFVFFTLFPIALLGAHTFFGLALAFMVRGLKEFGEPARKALIIGQAHPNIRSRTFGAYYLIRDCVVTLGSFLGAWLWTISPRANFLTAASVGGFGTIWFWWFVFRPGRGKGFQEGSALER